MSFDTIPGLGSVSRRDGRSWIMTGAVLGGVALVVGMLGAATAAVAVSVAPESSEVTLAAPVEATAQLSEGSHTLYGEELGPDTPVQPVTADMVGIVGPDGEPVPVEALDGDPEVVERGAVTFAAIGRFEVAEAGDHGVAVSVDPAVVDAIPVDVLVVGERSTSGTLLAGGIVGAVLGGVVLVAAVVLMVKGFSRLSAANREDEHGEPLAVAG